MSHTPEITVIVPVLNAASHIEECVECLLGQSLPKERYEIVIVDNGSTDGTPDLLRKYPVRSVSERTVQSPYAARNKGLDVAGGTVIAFTDSDCYADDRWLECGLRHLRKDGADMVGGNVKFRYSDPPQAGEIYDSISNLEMKNNIRKKGVAKTGNLFVKKELFTSVGFFEDDVRSGGDVEWTGRASGKGYKIVFGENAVVWKRARGLRRLLKKQVRVGKGQVRVWMRTRKSAGFMIKELLKGFRPVSRTGIRNMIRERGKPAFEEQLNQLYFVGFLCRLSTSIGRVTALIKFMITRRI